MIAGKTHWVCDDGRILSPAEMHPQHMLNCIRMVMRSRRVSAALTRPTGPMAAEEASEQYFQPDDGFKLRKALELMPVLKLMRSELRKKHGVNNLLKELVKPPRFGHIRIHRRKTR